MIYPDESICHQALDSVIEQDPKAICIPYGKDLQAEQAEHTIQSFFEMIKRLKEEQPKVVDK